MLNLITDRTHLDVALGTKKGYYNYDDLNRVSSAMDYLASELSRYGHAVPGYSKGPVWTELDEPNQQQMNQYLASAAAIRSAITALKTTPEVPGSMNNFTYDDANNLEKILVDIENLLDSITRVFIRSGGHLSISGVGYYFPELYYVLQDSDGVDLLDTTGWRLRAI